MIKEKEMQLMVGIIDTVTRRGAFQGDELESVAYLRGVLVKQLEEADKKQKEGKTVDLQDEGEEPKTDKKAK